MRGAQRTTRIEGLAEISGGYDAFFVDIWGVLHDGRFVYPGAPEALATARQQGGRVVLVTNSSSSVDVIAGKLDRMGISRDAWDAIISSGELCHRRLAATLPPPPIHIIREGSGPSWLGSLANPVVGSVEDAAVLLVTGMPCHTEAEARASGLSETLVAAHRQGIAMICTDPDEVYPENGRIRLGPGWLARQYRDLGGRVVEYGKPHPDIYAAARDLAGAPDRVLVIGDNLATDIAGANREGYDSLLLLDGGVHSAEDSNMMYSGHDSGAPVPTFQAHRLR